MTPAFLPGAAVYLGYSVESNGDGAPGHLALFYFPNISPCLVLLQLSEALPLFRKSLLLSGLSWKLLSLSN